MFKFFIILAVAMLAVHATETENKDDLKADETLYVNYGVGRTYAYPTYGGYAAVPSAGLRVTYPGYGVYPGYGYGYGYRYAGYPSYYRYASPYAYGGLYGGERLVVLGK